MFAARRRPLILRMAFAAALAATIASPMPVPIALASPGATGATGEPPKSFDEPRAPVVHEAQIKTPKVRPATADHSRHEALKADLKSGPEVTRACLSCHNQAALQFHKSIHWTWISPDSSGERRMGKAGDVINNFCISIAANEPRCTSCHAGYGWKDKNFDFASQENVDCLVCHERTGSYKKFPAGAGHPVSEPKQMGKETFLPPEWNKVAQSVGRPTRENCGTCHFYGGGGDAVKHGDLDSSMAKPRKSLDVHMGVDGGNFDCVRCHTTEAHQISGRQWSIPAALKRVTLNEDDLASRVLCESCHTSKPHKPGVKANDHTDKVACQTCHIPTFARQLPTKTYWDWSQAGTFDETGKQIVKKNEFGFSAYDTMKGAFVWEKDVKPVYAWYAGVIDNLTVHDRIDPSKTVRLTAVKGEPSDPNARIAPFKLHGGKQPYDTKLMTFVMPKLFGPKGSGAYWGDYDWNKAIAVGMAYAGHPYSGGYGWVETEWLFPVNHMVAPKEQTLTCEDCHAPSGRMAAIAGVYMPGRDSSGLVDGFGWLAVGGSLLAVAGHGYLRIRAAGARKEGES